MIRSVSQATADGPVAGRLDPPGEESRGGDCQEAADALRAVALSSQALHDREDLSWAHHPTFSKQGRGSLHHGQLRLEVVVDACHQSHSITAVTNYPTLT